MNNCCRVALHIKEADSVSLHVGGVIYSGESYEGEYNVTPSEVTQTLQTRGKRLNQNVVVEPIPQNYGRISYSGSVITVW